MALASFAGGVSFFPADSVSSNLLLPVSRPWVLLLLFSTQRNGTIPPILEKQVNLGKQIKKKKVMASMEGLIGLMNRIQRACTALGDHGGGSDLPTLWESLPTIAVVGGQVLLVSISLRTSGPPSSHPDARSFRN